MLFLNSLFQNHLHVIFDIESDGSFFPFFSPFFCQIEGLVVRAATAAAVLRSSTTNTT